MVIQTQANRATTVRWLLSSQLFKSGKCFYIKHNIFPLFFSDGQSFFVKGIFSCFYFSPFVFSLFLIHTALKTQNIVQVLLITLGFFTWSKLYLQIVLPSFEFYKYLSFQLIITSSPMQNFQFEVNYLI